MATPNSNSPDQLFEAIVRERSEQKRRHLKDRLLEIQEDLGAFVAQKLESTDADFLYAALDLVDELSAQKLVTPLIAFLERDDLEGKAKNTRGIGAKVLANRVERDELDTDHLERLEKLTHDEDPFVRAHALRGLIKVAPDAIESRLETLLTEEEPFVRRSVRASLDRFEPALIEDPGQMPRSLLMNKLGESESFRESLNIRKLVGRRDAQTVCKQLLAMEEPVKSIGLQLLQLLEDEGVVETALSHFERTHLTSHRAVCLEVISRHLDGPASSRQIAAIQQGLKSGDDYVHLSSLKAAAASRHPQLIRRVLVAIEETTNGRLAKVIAKVLANAVTGAESEVFSEVRTTLERVHSTRTREPEDFEDWLKTEAYLIRTLRHLLGEHTSVDSQFIRDVLDRLADSAHHRPLVITSVELLLTATAPEDRNDADLQWHPYYGRSLVRIYKHFGKDVQKRVLKLLARRAPGDTPELSEALVETAPTFEAEDLEALKALLARLPTSHARQLVAAIEREGTPELAQPISQMAETLDLE